MSPRNVAATRENDANGTQPRHFVTPAIEVETIFDRLATEHHLDYGRVSLRTGISRRMLRAWIAQAEYDRGDTRPRERFVPAYSNVVHLRRLLALVTVCPTLDADLYASPETFAEALATVPRVRLTTEGYARARTWREGVDLEREP